MTVATEKDQVFQDYRVLFQAFLPQTIGLQCHDAQGNVFWREEENGIPLSAELDSRLAEVLKEPAKASSIGRVRLGACQAYLAPLYGNKQSLLGVVTLYVEESADTMSNEACIDLLRPVLSSLQRELSLRFRLIDNQKKMRIHAAEESLLHRVEMLVHQKAACDTTMAAILRSCRRLIPVASAAVMIPDRGIRIFQGTAEQNAAIESWLDELFLKPETGPKDEVLAKDDASNVLALPINHGSTRGIGYIVLSGWGKSSFGAARRRRLLRFIAFQIETVLNSNYDELTGLLSWHAFERDLIDATRSESPDDYTVMYLDVDRLTVINETHGRELGDEILTEFSRIIRRYLEGHMVTRIASDSFAVLMSDTNRDQAKFVAKRICEEFQLLEYVRDGQTCRPTCSAGVAPLSLEGGGGSSALSMAQVACNAAKDRGRGRVEVYRAMDESIIRRFDDIQMVGDIRSAIDANRLVLVGQPIVALQKGYNHKYFEVLVRMLGLDGRLIPPAEFFSSAERYQLMEELDHWVVTSTLEAVNKFGQTNKGVPIRFAINLSGQSLGSEPFLSYVEQEIKRIGVPPWTLCFELTETVAIAHVDRAQRFIDSLKAMGCKFSLDDFGTGLSSFGYLKQFAVDTVKIDGSFIKDLATNNISQAVVKAITEIARTMDLETVAEYVQDDRTIDLLRDLGVTWAQGYHTGAPLPLDEQFERMNKENADRSKQTVGRERFSVNEDISLI